MSGRRSCPGATIAFVFALAALFAHPALAGDGDDALPAVADVAVPTAMPVLAAVALSTRMGYRGATLGTDDRHVRVSARLGASLRPLPWLGLGLRLDGRYDGHTGGPDGDDDGWIAEPRAFVRAVRPLGSGVSIGAQADLRFPAASLFDVSGASGELRALLGAELDGGVTLGAAAGLRLDRSAATVDNPLSLSLSDRMALGAADANAVLLAAAASRRRGGLELGASLGWDLLVGDDAPAASESPLLASAELGVALGDRLWLRGGLTLTLSATPAIEPDAPLVPIEPRVAGWVGLVAGFDRAPALLPTPGEHRPAPAEPAPTSGTVAGRVVDVSGTPIADAVVSVGARTATSGVDGRFRIDDIPPGPAALAVQAPRYRRLARTVSVEPGAERALELALELDLPPGQIRGLVRNLAGSPIPGAKIAVSPLGAVTESAGDGSFRLDVPPGDYTVEVSAPAFDQQTRELRVDENGVTVLNVELRKGSR
jgi:hypothetical protein